jgi:hypothetical protein
VRWNDTWNEGDHQTERGRGRGNGTAANQRLAEDTRRVPLSLRVQGEHNGWTQRFPLSGEVVG